MTIKESIDKYIVENRAFLKPRTLDKYEATKEAILKEWGNINVDELTQEFMQEFILTSQRNGKSKSTINGILSLIKCSTQRCYSRFRYLREQPKERNKTYTADEIAKIKDYIRESDKTSYIPIFIAIETGMRIGEILALKWGDIDFDNEIIKVQRNAFKRGTQEIIETPKTASGNRVIPLTDDLFAYLYYKQGNADHYVISGETLKNTRAVQGTNERLLKMLGIKPLGMHAYRHTFATRLLSKTTDTKAVQEIIGHSNIGITQNIYNHPTMERKAEIVKDAPKPIDSTLVEQMMQAFATLGEVIEKGFERLTTDLLNLQESVRNASQEVHYKYVVTGRHIKPRYYLSKYEMLEDLDITEKVLQSHLNGRKTILNELELKVTQLEQEDEQYD